MSKKTYPGKKWALDDTRQVDWIHREILCMAKSYNPLAEVEALFKSTLEDRVLPLLRAALVIATTYDLWMTYGTTNVFAFNALTCLGMDSLSGSSLSFLFLDILAMKIEEAREISSAAVEGEISFANEAEPNWI